MPYTTLYPNDHQALPEQANDAFADAELWSNPVAATVEALEGVVGYSDDTTASNTHEGRILAIEGGLSDKRSASVTAASSIVLLDGRVVPIAGTTSINTISTVNAGGRNLRGRVVVLEFLAAGKVNHGTGNIQLAKGQSYSPQIGDTLTLECDGTAWYEVTRSRPIEYLQSGIATILKFGLD